MKFTSTALLALATMPTLGVEALSVEARRRGRRGGGRRTLHTNKHRVQRGSRHSQGRRYLFRVAGGFPNKKDHLKDFRDQDAVVGDPTAAPTKAPRTSRPTRAPVTTLLPTKAPAMAPTDSPVEPEAPTKAPVVAPTNPPTDSPTMSPDVPEPTASPVATPTATPDEPASPTSAPTFSPTSSPVDVCDAIDNLVLEEPDDEELDIGLDGYTSGDVYTWHGNTLQVDLQDVGTSSGRCIVLQTEDADDNVYCTIEMEFGDGNLVVLQGVFFELIAITGTGCYQGIQGYISLEDDPRDLDRYGYDFTVVDDNNGCPAADAEALLSSPWTEAAGEELIDWDEDGEVGPGDVVVFDGKAVTTGGGAEGFIEGECMFLYDPIAETTNSENPYCLITFYTENGDILQTQGLYDNMVITSAQGCFFGTTGSLSGTASAEGGYMYELDVSPPSTCTQGLFDEPWLELYGDAFVDYVFNPDAEDDQGSPGDAYVFENKLFSVPSTGGTGLLAGRCFILPDDEAETFCNIVFTIDGEGSIVTQGFFDNLIIVGGSGCFQGLTGTAEVDEDDDGFLYSWTF